MAREVRLREHGAAQMTCLLNWWCRHFHTGISRPFQGAYHCWHCLREYKAPWQ